MSIAGLYTLVATCEARGINHPKRRVDELLPGAWARTQADAWTANCVRRDLTATLVSPALVTDTIGQMGDSKRPPSEIRSATTPGVSPRRFEEWRADPANAMKTLHMHLATL